MSVPIEGEVVPNKREVVPVSKKRVVSSMVLLLLVSFGVSSAQGSIILDNYWGGAVRNANPDTYGDVLQPRGSHLYEVDGMEVTSKASLLTVRIYGQYFSQSSVTPGGDLYISSNGWEVSNKSDPAHYKTDTFKRSEGWNYVVSLATGKVYALDFNKIEMSSGSSGSVYRKDQAWRGGYGNLLSQGTVTLTNNALTFTFDKSALNLKDSFGLHWTMQCGNDVVEGAGSSSPVPAPPAIVLLLSGLVGMGIFRKKFQNSAE